MTQKKNKHYFGINYIVISFYQNFQKLLVIYDKEIKYYQRGKAKGSWIWSWDLQSKKQHEQKSSKYYFKINWLTVNLKF